MAEETSGRRVRRTTQVFTIEQPKADDAEAFTPPKGSGAVVGDMAFVGDQLRALNKKQVEMLRHLYGVLYGRRFQIKNMKVIKEHILEFSGIPTQEQDEKAREHLFFKIDRLKRNFLVEMMDLLAVDRFKKTSEDDSKPLDKKGLVNCFIDWLYNPQETKIAQRKAANALKAEKRLERKRAQKAKAKDKKPAKKTTKRKAPAVEDEDEESEVSESEGEDSSSDFEASKKSPKKRRKVTRRPKKSQVVESDEGDEEQEASDTKEAAEDDAQPAAEPEVESATKSDAEPLAADVCDKVRDIIAHGNSDELTVKKIVRQLSEEMGRDMSSQKKAIKEFITGDQMV